MLRVEMLPANHGDCLWIEYGPPDQPRRILVDAGPSYAYKALKSRLESRLASLPAGARRFELLVISHIDEDHIGGVLPLLMDQSLGLSFGDVWFNGLTHLEDARRGVLGGIEGEQLTGLLLALELPWNRAFKKRAVAVPDRGMLPTVELDGGLRLTVLSPMIAELRKLLPHWERDVRRMGLTAGSPEEALKLLNKKKRGRRTLGDDDEGLNLERLIARESPPDTSPPNCSSIVLLLEYGGHSCLLAADGSPSVLERSVERLRRERNLTRIPLSIFKLPHHGSKFNISTALLSAFECERYLFSSNGAISGHPHREAVARVILKGGDRPTLFFNYRSKKNCVWNTPALKDQYGYDTRFPPEGRAGLTVTL